MFNEFRQWLKNTFGTQTVQEPAKIEQKVDIVQPVVVPVQPPVDIVQPVVKKARKPRKPKAKTNE